MDAATLYMVLTLPSGEQSTSTKWFWTVEACETYATSQQLHGYANQPLGARIEYRCDPNPMIGDGFVLDVCEGRDTPCTSFGPWPHLRRCDAHRWMVRLKERMLKERVKILYCWERSPRPARPLPADNRQGGEDFLDMLGQPGQK